MIMLLFENLCCGGLVGGFMTVIIGKCFSVDQRCNTAFPTAVLRVIGRAGLAAASCQTTGFSGQ